MLQQYDLSAGGAAELIDLLRKGTRCQSNPSALTSRISDLRILCQLAGPVFVDMRSEEASAPDFQRFECKTQEGLHDFLLLQGAIGLKRVDVEDAPVCDVAGDLEEGCRYDLVFGRGRAWAKPR